MKNTLITGSLAYDYIMGFSGVFADSILPEKLKILNVSFTAESMHKNYGGTAGNIAYCMALLKESPFLFSTVGSDFGEYENRLNKLGVNTEHIHKYDNELTASAHIITDNDKNQITAFHGGAMLRNDISMTPILEKISPEIVIIAANGRDGMLRYVKELKTNKTKYIYDPGQSLPAFNGEELLKLADGSFITIMNEYEEELFLEKTGINREKLLEMVKYFIVTKGGKGSTIYSKGEEINVSIANLKQILDPTGAGDAFRGGLLKGLVNDLPIKDCVELGTLTACYAIEEVGTQSYSYTIDEFEQRFKENYGEKDYIKKIF